MGKLKTAFYIFLVSIGWLFVTLTLLMYWVLPCSQVQHLLQEQLTEAVGLPVQLDSARLRWTGVQIKNLTVLAAENATEQPIISAKELFLKGAPWKILAGKIDLQVIKLHNPSVYLTRDPSGKWNIDPLFGSEETPSEEDTEEQKEQGPFFLQIQVSDVQLSNGKFVLDDQKAKYRLEISELFIEGKKIKSDGEFPLNLSAVIAYEQADMPKQDIKLALRSLLDLKELNFQEAGAKIKELLVRHEGGTFNLSGQVEKWGNPQVQLVLSVRNLSDKIARFSAADMAPFTVETLKIDLDAKADLQQNTLQVNRLGVDVQEPVFYNQDGNVYFQTPQLTAYAKGSADWGHSKAHVSSFTVQGLSSILSSTGTITWGKKTSFSTHNLLEADLAGWGQTFADWTSYQLKGTLSGSADISSEQWSGKLHASQVGATLPSTGTFSDVAFTLNMPNKTQAKIPDLKGKINGGDFTGSLAATYTKTGITADLKAHAKRVALPSNTTSNTATSKNISDEQPVAKEKSSGTSLPPIVLKAMVDIGSLDAPFIAAEKLQFNADLKQITPLLDQTHGTISLSLGKGEIKDMDQLTHANILTRVLFGSLGAVSRVINSLNVLSVLNGIGSGLINTVTGGNKEEEQMVVRTIQDENGNDVNILVPASSVSTSGRWAFEKFETALDFNDGVADVSKGLFASDLMSFRLKGNMNFKTRGLDMKVQAAPGLHLDDGIMPLTIKIGGTLDDPSGSMSLSSTVTSMIGQTLTNNFAARTAKKGISSVVGIFKKKTPASEGETTAEEEQAAELQETPAEGASAETTETAETAEAAELAEPVLEEKVAEN